MSRKRFVREGQLALAFCLFILLSFLKVGYSMEPVVVEFLYYEPCDCDPDDYEIYEHNNQVVDSIESVYGSKVLVNRIYFFSMEGQNKTLKYRVVQYWNTIVINYERVFTGSVNETHLREIIDAYLTDSVHDVAITKVIISDMWVEVGEKVNITVTAKNFGIENESFSVTSYINETMIGKELVNSLSPKHEFSKIFVWDTSNQTSGDYVIRAEAEPVLNETNLANNVYTYPVEVKSSSSSSLLGMFVLAFSFGFFETFSPCLIILLSFILSYTIGETSSFKESFSKIMIFGAGFILATLLLALAFGLLFLSTPILQRSLMWIVSIFAIVLGLNLMGVLRFERSKKSLQSKPLIKKLARKYVITYVGIFLLGFIFYFLDPCIAPIFVSMMPILLPETLFLTLAVFCLGAFLPFIGIGFFAGSISKLVRSTYRQRFKIRAISGLILIGFSLYLIVFQLIL